MLTPQQLLEIIDALYPKIDELNTWISSDIIKRIMARLTGTGNAFLTATDEWQLQVYQAAGGHLEAVQQEIKRWTKMTDAEIRRIFEDAGIKAIAYDNSFYVERGLAGIELAQSENMIRLLEDTYQRTAGTVRNFTRTTAYASQQRLIEVLDSTHFKVISGATSYTQAVQEAVSRIVDTQTQVTYPTGHVDTIETAVLRAVRTGVAQASGNMALQGMEERDWDVVLVSAHLGARYGDGGQNPGNHFWWQGKFYSRTGRTPDLPLLWTPQVTAPARDCAAGTAATASAPATCGTIHTRSSTQRKTRKPLTSVRSSAGRNHASGAQKQSWLACVRQ